MRFVFLLLLVISLQVSGQVPQAINYQGILRNASGQAIPNKQVKIRVSVSTNSVVDNNSVYTEEISAKTNEFGIYNVAIGKGKATKGTFASIAWGSNKYWVLIELDENLTNKFEFAGSMELASVPYALYAEKARNVDNPVPGPAGPQGPQGLQGLQGIKGDKGDRGDTGAAGANGAQGPQGLQGIKGDTGPAGANGAQGLQGMKGDKGDTGPTGPQGPIGLTGPAGPAGPAGATGPQGPIGLTGPAGATGAQGPQGPIGLTGPAGATGAQGPQGTLGLTGPAGATGAQGPQGPIGLTGPAGATGAQGPQGPQGPIGLTGPAGATGAQGPQGPQGPIGLTGPAGATGPQGPIGITGPAGANGAQGIAGADGKTVLNGLTDPTIAIGNDGDFYINTVTNKFFGPKANGQWLAGISLIGPQGPQGLTGPTGPQNSNGSSIQLTTINSYLFPDQNEYYWGMALIYTAGFSSQGFSDWHMPSQHEMISLISKYGLSIFPNSEISYWTRSSETGGLNFPTNNFAYLQPIIMSIGMNDHQGAPLGPIFQQANQYKWYGSNPNKARLILVR